MKAVEYFSGGSHRLHLFYLEIDIYIPRLPSGKVSPARSNNRLQLGHGQASSVSGGIAHGKVCLARPPAPGWIFPATGITRLKKL